MLYIREEHVRDLLTMPEAIEAMEQSFRDQANLDAAVFPRTRIRARGASLNMMPAVAPNLGGMGFKIIGGAPGGRPRAQVLYYDTATGNFAAIIEANLLSQIRTGAATGVATKYLAREDAATVGLIGTGFQARTQLEAVCKVRPITRAVAFSRNPERRALFCSRMAQQLGIEVVPAESAEEAVKGADIVNLMTNASQPVFLGAMVERGQHINAAGANSLLRREVDEEVVRQASVITIDDLEQGKLECGDLWVPVERGMLSWEQVYEFGEVVAGHRPGRTSRDQVTLFESQGIGLWDVAAAAVIYKNAVSRGIGDQLPI